VYFYPSLYPRGEHTSTEGRAEGLHSKVRSESGAGHLVDVRVVDVEHFALTGAPSGGVERNRQILDDLLGEVREF
jgi:hypothetical protein